MKLKVFSFQERHYKKLVAFFVVLVTAVSVYFSINYTKNNEQSVGFVTFLVSIAYALFLFIVGLYISTIKGKLDNKFFVAKDHYVTISKLNGLFSSPKNEICNYENTRLFIISHQAFTSRIDGMEEGKAYIKPTCFSNRQIYLKCEFAFLQTYDDFFKKIRNTVSDYTETHEITKKVPYPHISNIDRFISNYSAWFSEHFTASDEQVQNFCEFTNELLQSNKGLRLRLWLQKSAIAKWNQIISKKIKARKGDLESIYGQKLVDALDSEYQLKHIMNALESMLSAIKQQEEDISDISNSIGELHDSIDEKISQISEMLTVESEKLDSVLDQLDDF